MNNIYLSVFTQGACRRKILRLVHVDPDLEGRRVKIFYGDEGHIILLLLIPLCPYIYWLYNAEWWASETFP